MSEPRDVAPPGMVVRQHDWSSEMHPFRSRKDAKESLDRAVSLLPKTATVVAAHLAPFSPAELCWVWHLRWSEPEGVCDPMHVQVNVSSLPGAPA